MAGKGFKLADAYVEVHGDGSGVANDVAADVEKGTGKASSSGMKLAKGFVGGFVAYEGFKVAKDFIGDSIGKASDLNETISASQAIFGSSAGSIAKWADNAAQAMGLSKSAAIDAATSFGDMFQQIGFTQDAATKNSKSVVQMAADLGSFKNLPTGDVLDMISGAMRGEYDSLQRVIPNINAARVQQEALTETGKKSASQLTAQEKAQATLNIINKDGSRAMGDFAKTSGGAANQQKIMAAQTEDLKASLGTALLPIVRTLMGVFTTVFLPMLKGIAQWIAKNKDVIGPLVIILGILAAAIWVVNIALDANPIVLIIMGVMALIVAIILLITNWDAVVKFLSTTWQGFVGWFMGVWNGFIGWLGGVWAGFVGWLAGVWNGFIGWIVGVWNGFIGWIMDGVHFLLAAWISGWSAIGSFIAGIWHAIVSTATGLWGGLMSFFGGIPGKIVAVFVGAATMLGQIGHNIVQGLWDGISGAWTRFQSWWQGIIGGIADVAKKLLGIKSPSQVFRYEIGAQIVEGAELGIKDRQSSLKRTVIDTFDLSGNADLGLGAGTGKSKGGGDSFTFGDITVQADQLSDMQKAIDTLKSIGQASRQGKGLTAGIG